MVKSGTMLGQVDLRSFLLSSIFSTLSLVFKNMSSVCNRPSLDFHSMSFSCFKLSLCLQYLPTYSLTKLPFLHNTVGHIHFMQKA